MNHVLGFACNVDFHATCMNAKGQRACYSVTMDSEITQLKYFDVCKFFSINCLFSNAYDEKVILTLIYIKTLDACRLWNFIKVSILLQPL